MCAVVMVILADKQAHVQKSTSRSFSRDEQQAERTLAHFVEIDAVERRSRQGHSAEFHDFFSLVDTILGFRDCCAMRT